VRRITVLLGPRSYDVIVGQGLLDQAGSLLPETPGTRRVVILTDSGVGEIWGARAEAALKTRGEIVAVQVASGEASKVLAVAEQVMDRMVSEKVGRSDLLVTLGGGMVSDLGGFVASVYHRGIRVAHLPTSLLGQVDAAVGGKTGVNLGGGKNLAGTYHQPIAVIADTETLATLPEREFTSGLAEVIKCGLALEPSLLDLLEPAAPAVAAREPEVLAELVAACVRIKAGVVAQDEFDQDRRAMLNYGHTLGHALEAESGFGVLHGEAIAVGMVASAHLAADSGLLDEGEVRRHISLLERFRLPVTASFDPEAVLERILLDKKRRGEGRWVLLKGLGHPVVVPVSEEAALTAIQKVLV
jgi:3-dehydroquinate synthase